MQSTAGVQSHEALELLKTRLGSRVVTSRPELERVSRDTSYVTPPSVRLWRSCSQESTEDVYPSPWPGQTNTASRYRCAVPARDSQAVPSPSKPGWSSPWNG